MKKQTIIIIAIVLIAMLASAQDRQIGDQIGKLVKKDEVTISSNVDFQKHGDITTLTFKENNGYIKIRKNLFMNIKKQDKNTNSYLKLDDKGVIIEADFTTTQEGVYIINNDKVNLPPNSRVIYKNNKIKLLIPDNAKIKEMPSVVDQKYGSNFIDIQGKNIGLPGGNTLQEGTLSYLAGKPYIKQGGTATINGLKIESMSKAVEIKFESKGYLQSIKEYFGLSKETGDYVRFSDKIEINGNGFRVKMNPEEFMTDGQQKYTNEYLSTLSLSKSKNGKFFQIGDRGDDVKSIQKLVGVEEDGIFGKKTEQALKNWREENGLSKEGKFDSAALEKALSDSTRNVQITPKGGRVILSKNNNRFNLDFTGDSTLKLGSQVYDIQSAITSGEEQGKVYKRIKTQIANNLEVPTDLTLRDRDGNEISRVVNVEGPGIKETVISFIKEGVRNQGYFTSHYKTSIHVNTVLFDNLPELGSLTADKGIISNTIIPDKYVSEMKKYVNSQEVKKIKDPDERFNMIVRKAGEITNYHPEHSLKLIGAFGSRYKDLSPNYQEGYGNIHLVNGKDTTEYKNLIPPISSKVAQKLNLPQDKNADKKYRLLTVAGNYLYNQESLLGDTRIALQHTSYELLAYFGRKVKEAKSGRVPAYGSGDFGDIQADLGAVAFGKDLRNKPEQTLKNFDVKKYIG